ncbi:MAG TPA: patatin-like phospholipase family protein [Vitreimonas sp.]|uniref:patatin-like phospholipase family protein n=1 Tax=Vitreimonas sp. TaxID=3069702 RepID=UPI002D5BB37A|nr:patatin-like phospholipase family protein [Vitreimonas sp.]HYD88286.1 patatin-like phospholipase family protein [Vitreimonas sp.]
MSRTLFEHLSPDTGAKRMLALDGGGVRSVLTLGVLKALEDELRRRAGGGSGFRLSDYYDLIGGSSTGAIVDAGLSLGYGVEPLAETFLAMAPEAYGRSAGDDIHIGARFSPVRLRRALQRIFANRTLGSQDIKTGLAILAKRVDTGACWLFTNHPLGAFYDPPEGEQFANKKYRLVDVLAASVASPALLNAVSVDVEFDEKRRSRKKGYFIDANLNPGQQLFVMALDPGYRFGWYAGPDALMMTSIGSGLRRPAIAGAALEGLAPGLRAMHVTRAMAYDALMHGVALLQAMSSPRKPWIVNQELGDQSKASIAALLDYQRIDVALDTKPKPRHVGDPQPPMTHLERMIGRELDPATLQALARTDNTREANLELLYETGVAAGRAYVNASYPDPKFDLTEWGEAERRTARE